MLGSGRKSGNNISAALEQDEKKQQKDRRPTTCCTSTQSLFSRYLSASTGRIHCLRAEYLSTTCPLPTQGMSMRAHACA